jgi:hypothetical protein
MQRLQIQLLVGLGGHEAGRRPLHRLSPLGQDVKQKLAKKTKSLSDNDAALQQKGPKPPSVDRRSNRPSFVYRIVQTSLE